MRVTASLSHTHISVFRFSSRCGCRFADEKWHGGGAACRVAGARLAGVPGVPGGGSPPPARAGPRAGVPAGAPRPLPPRRRPPRRRRRPGLQLGAAGATSPAPSPCRLAGHSSTGGFREAGAASKRKGILSGAADPARRMFLRLTPASHHVCLSVWVMGLHRRSKRLLTAAVGGPEVNGPGGAQTRATYTFRSSPPQPEPMHLDSASGPALWGGFQEKVPCRPACPPPPLCFHPLRPPYLVPPAPPPVVLPSWWCHPRAQAG